MTPREVEAAEWGGRRGDYWHRRWTRTAGTSTLTDPVMEIRHGAGEPARLVASSVTDRQGPTVAKIDMSDTDLAAGPPVLDWVIEPVETLKLEASASYILEVEVLEDGKARTIMRHAWRVDPQVAVRPVTP